MVDALDTISTLSIIRGLIKSAEELMHTIEFRDGCKAGGYDFNNPHGDCEHCKFVSFAYYETGKIIPGTDNCLFDDLDITIKNMVEAIDAVKKAHDENK